MGEVVNIEDVDLSQERYDNEFYNLLYICADLIDAAKVYPPNSLQQVPRNFLKRMVDQYRRRTEPPYSFDRPWNPSRNEMDKLRALSETDEI